MAGLLQNPITLPHVPAIAAHSAVLRAVGALILSRHHCLTYFTSRNLWRAPDAAFCRSRLPRGVGDGRLLACLPSHDGLAGLLVALYDLQNLPGGLRVLGCFVQ